MTVYDRLAADFDRRRPLPEGVPGAIRAAVLEELPAKPSVLDLGCGAGRIGWPFVDAADNYTAVDASFGMLRNFASRALAAPPCLAQADGAMLPFAGAVFDAVLLVQVLSGTGAWRDLLREVRRVMRDDAVLFVGQSTAPDDGVDARMKQHLSEVLDDMGLQPYQRKSKEDAFGWLDRHAARTTVTVARWPMQRTPRQFIERHGAGARFSVLEDSVKAAAMDRLRAWATTTFGSLDAVATEEQRFVLDTYRFSQRTTH